MKYLYFKNEPGAIIHEVEASSKKDALKKISELYGTKFSFGSFHKPYEYELVTQKAWRNYDFRCISYIVRKEQHV